MRRHLAMLLVSVVAFAGISTVSQAADQQLVTKAKRVVTKAPPPPPPSGSTGFYVGINGGYDWGRATFSNFLGASTSINVPSGMAGLTFGYNAQSGSFVYGLENDIDAAWLSNTNWGVPPCFACETRLTYFGTLRARAGYAIGQALPYITGGFAYGGVKTGLVFGGTTDEAVKGGWTVGAGVEYAIMGSWSVKTEYLYFELARTTCSVAACGALADVKFQGNLVRAGLNYRF
jgi:outer membrane immunogenic protein